MTGGERATPELLEIAWMPTGTAACAGHGNCDEMTLRYHCFPGDLVLRTAHWDGSARWGWVQGFDMAMALLHTVAELRERTPQRSALDLTDSDYAYRFERDGELVRMAADWAPGSDGVTLDELTRAVDAFARAVLDRLVGTYPDLLLNEAFVSAVARFGPRP